MLPLTPLIFNINTSSYHGVSYFVKVVVSIPTEDLWTFLGIPILFMSPPYPSQWSIQGFKDRSYFRTIIFHYGNPRGHFKYLLQKVSNYYIILRFMFFIVTLTSISRHEHGACPPCFLKIVFFYSKVEIV
jgi:hypothetical protein